MRCGGQTAAVEAAGGGRPPSPGASGHASWAPSGSPSRRFSWKTTEKVAAARRTTRASVARCKPSRGARGAAARYSTPGSASAACASLALSPEGDAGPGGAATRARARGQRWSQGSARLSSLLFLFSYSYLMSHFKSYILNNKSNRFIREIWKI